MASLPIEAATKCHFADDIFERIFFNGTPWLSIDISL